MRGEVLRWGKRNISTSSCRRGEGGERGGGHAAFSVLVLRGRNDHGVSPRGGISISLQMLGEGKLCKTGCGQKCGLCPQVTWN